MLPITDETLFKRMLWLERRRCERTGTRCALMLLATEELAPALNTRSIEKIGLALGASMRETDITGWYEQYSTIGVVFTALSGTDRKPWNP